MSGIYYRVRRNDKWENVEIEHLTVLELREMFENADKDYLIRVIDVLCVSIRQIERFLPDELK